MPMNAANLANEIVNQIEAQLMFTFSPSERANAKKVWDAVSIAIVNHIQANANTTFIANEFTVDSMTLQNNAFTNRGRIT